MSKPSKKFLKASWPAFGGKASIAKLVWERFGNVDNAIEPFCNSAAMMLKNPWGGAHYETINDLNCFVANYWRSVKMAPDQVAEHSDWPVSEVDLHARHRWLVSSDDAAAFREKMLADPKYYDPMVAGWWAWGQCLWIGSGWCETLSEKRPQLFWGTDIHGSIRPGGKRNPSPQRPDLAGGYAANNPSMQRPSIWNSRGVLGEPSQQLPCLKPGGMGINSPSSTPKKWAEENNMHRPQLADAHARGRGVHANDQAGTCEERRLWLREWMQTLSDRFRNVRVCCGDWKRVCSSPSVTTRLGLTAVFLDPPYRTHVEGKESRKAGLYATDGGSDLDQLQKDVLKYCLKHGPNPQMRIAICALEGEGYEPLVEAGWEVVPWQSKGYGMRTEKGKENASRERVWFSPYTLVPNRDLHPLFAGMDDEDE
jgi:site-specific DNA-adenine methylase